MIDILNTFCIYIRNIKIKTKIYKNKKRDNYFLTYELFCAKNT